MAPQFSRSDRWLALGLLLGVVGIAYLLLVHPLWTRPWREVGIRIAELQDRQQRIDTQLGQAPQVKQQLEQVQRSLDGQSGFMPEASAELATSRLVQRLEEAARQVSPDGRSCAVSDRSPLPADSRERFVRVAVQARLRCGMSEWAALLQRLESGAPQLRVGRLTVLAVDGPGAANGLEVSFELSGYLRPGMGSPAKEVSNAP